MTAKPTFDPVIRVDASTAMSLRFGDGRIATADLVALLCALDIRDRSPDEAGAPVPSGWKTSEADLRRKTATTSGPAFPRLLERLRSLHVHDPATRLDDPGYLRAFDRIAHYPCGPDRSGGDVYAWLHPMVAIGFCPVLEATTLKVDVRWLHGLTLPAAMTLLKILAVEAVGVRKASELSSGRVRVTGRLGGCTMNVTAANLATGFLGRTIVRRHASGEWVHAPVEEIRVLKSICRELKAFGLTVGYARPRAVRGRAPLELWVKGFVGAPKGPEAGETSAKPRRGFSVPDLGRVTDQ